MSIEGQGHFFTIYFPGFVCFVLYLAKISGKRLQDHWSSGLAHLSRRLIGELIVYQSSRRPWVCALTLSNMNISATSWPIGMKFYLKHHWGGGKASVGFDLGLWFPWQQIAPKVIMGKMVSSRFLECF